MLAFVEGLGALAAFWLACALSLALHEASHELAACALLQHIRTTPGQ